MPEHGYTISSLFEPDCSGELKYYFLHLTKKSKYLKADTLFLF